MSSRASPHCASPASSPKADTRPLVFLHPGFSPVPSLRQVGPEVSVKAKGKNQPLAVPWKSGWSSSPVWGVPRGLWGAGPRGLWPRSPSPPSGTGSLQLSVHPVQPAASLHRLETEAPGTCRFPVPTAWALVSPEPHPREHSPPRPAPGPRVPLLQGQGLEGLSEGGGGAGPSSASHSRTHSSDKPLASRSDIPFPLARWEGPTTGSKRTAGGAGGRGAVRPSLWHVRWPAWLLRTRPWHVGGSAPP